MKILPLEFFIEIHIELKLILCVCVETYSADPDTCHSDSILDVDVTHKLKLFVSCSLDCTVRIWSEDNTPIR